MCIEIVIKIEIKIEMTKSGQRSLACTYTMYIYIRIIIMLRHKLIHQIIIIIMLFNIFTTKK